MNKVVCNICGTSYPENVSECPICGFARSSDHSRDNAEHTYTHVPGGRFSKNNVRKRNRATQPKAAAKPHKKPAKKPVKSVQAEKPARKKEEKTSAGLVIVIILLLLAIIAVVAYIALRFFLPNDFTFDGLNNLSISSLFQREESASDDDVSAIPEETEPDTETQTDPAPEPVLCQQILLDQSRFDCEQIGATYQLTYQLSPAEAEEDVIFSSSNAAVASVDEFGMITVNAEGSATITVSCGSASAQCEISCVLPVVETVELNLNRKEITFTTEGESWMLYDGPVNVNDIVWTSDDTKVATIEDGKVIAVGEGDTTVYGFYEGQTVTCSIHCKFEDGGDDVTGNVSEAGGDTDDSKTYKLYNPHGRSDDVTMLVGKEFKLRLVDQYKNTVEGVQWKVEDDDICSYENGVVKALSAGTTKVIATYNGKSYSCIVRVNKK